MSGLVCQARYVLEPLDNCVCVNPSLYFGGFDCFRIDSSMDLLSENDDFRSR